MYSSFFSSRKYFLLHLWFGAQFLHQRPATYRILFIACPYLLSSLWSFLSFVSTSILRVWRKPWKKSHDQPRQHIKKQRHYLADKGPSSQSYGFPRSHTWMWKLDHKESWALKNWCFWTVMLEKTLESPLDCMDIKPVNPKGNQSWLLKGQVLNLKLQYFGHLMWRTVLFEKTLMLGKIEGGRRRGCQRMRWLDGITDQ